MEQFIKEGKDVDSIVINFKTEAETTNTPNNPVSLDEFDQEEVMKKIQKELKKKTRTMQRSLKLDKKVNDWLDNVKRYQKETLGIVRPCLDDLMYDAIVEYLKSHYMELEP